MAVLPNVRLQDMIDEARFEALNEAVRELLRRQRDMDDRLKRLEDKQDTGSVAPQPALRTVTADPVEADVPVLPSTPSPSTVNSFTSHYRAEEASEQAAPAHQSDPQIETKVGLTVVNRVGVVTLILGVGFFFKWAVDNDWIGPNARVILGLVAGFAALTAADFLWRKSQQVFAQGITGAGLAIVYLSAYAAFGFYHLIPAYLTFAFMASVTALAYALALRYDSAALAVLGFFGGFTTPFLLNNGEDHSWFLISYVLVLDLAAMRLVKQKRWTALELLALAATTAIYFSWFGSSPAHRGSAAATLGALAYYSLFTYAGSAISVTTSQLIAALQMVGIWPESAGPFFGLELTLIGAGLFQSVRRKHTTYLTVTFTSFWISAGLFLLDAEHVTTGAKFAGVTAGFLLFLLFNVAAESLLSFEATSTPSLSVIAANGSVYLGFSYLLLRSEYHNWLGLLAIFVAVSYLGLAFLLRKRNALRDGVQARPLLLALGMTVVFVTLAIPIQLTGFHITIAWAVQGAALSWISTKVSSRRVAIAASCILGLVALRLVIFDSTLYWQDRSTALILNGRFITFLFSALCGFAAARWGNISSPRLALAEYLGGHVSFLAGLTMETLQWVQRNSPAESVLSLETVSVSILFAIYALALVSLGVASRTAINRISGLALVGFVIVKLYLFDVWQLDRVYRIAAFVALGLLLISTSFLYSRFRPMIESLLRKDETSS